MKFEVECSELPEEASVREDPPMLLHRVDGHQQGEMMVDHQVGKN